ncbi:PAB1 binding protein [Savitreella phatthalungensis]
MSKRANEELDDGKNARRKLDDPTQCTGLSCIVDDAQAAAITGTDDEALTKLRDKVDAQVQVSPRQPGAIERIVTLYGTPAGIASAAKEFPIEGMLRIAVPHYHVGVITGPANVIRNDIIDRTGVKFNLTRTNLPLSTEKGLSLRGTTEQIVAALEMVARAFLGNRERAEHAVCVPYSPTSMGGRYLHPDTLRKIKPNDTMVTPSNPYGIAPASAAATVQETAAAADTAGGSAAAPTKAAEKIQQQIFIPNDMVGAIIGKAGSKINEIRNLSGSHIKIAEPDPTRPLERLIQVEGTAEQNQAALYMLYQRLEAEKRRT